MKRRSLRVTLCSPRVSIAAVLVTAPASADLPVIDVSVLSQNVLEAARAAAADQQPDPVAAERSDDAARTWPATSTSLNLSHAQPTGLAADSRSASSINQAQGIAFNVNATESAFAQILSAAICELDVDRPAARRCALALAELDGGIPADPHDPGADRAERLRPIPARCRAWSNASQGAIGNLQALRRPTSCSRSRPSSSCRSRT